MIGFFLLALALLGGILASYFDLKTREIPDSLTIMLIVSGLGIRLLYSAYSGGWGLFIDGVFSVAFLGAFGYIMYRTKQWGGGDLLLIAGMGATIGSLPADVLRLVGAKLAPWPFSITLLMNLLVVGSAYGILHILWLAASNKKVRSSFLAETHKTIWQPALMAVAAVGLWGVPTISVSLAIMVLFWPLYRLAKCAESVVFVREVKFGALREEDWLTEDIMVGSTIIARASSPGLSGDEVKRIKKFVAGGKLVGTTRIKEGIAFAPVFPLAIVASLLFGDIAFFAVSRLMI